MRFVRVCAELVRFVRVCALCAGCLCVHLVRGVLVRAPCAGCGACAQGLCARFVRNRFVRMFSEGLCGVCGEFGCLDLFSIRNCSSNHN